MEFYKMQGLGNDFIVLDDREGNYKNKEKETAIELCDRHLSIGGDGILLVRKSEICSIKMDIYNGDGSYASMCGNGIRCFAKYLYMKDIVKKEEIDIETGDGIKIAYLNIVLGYVKSVNINMGKGKFDKDLIDKKILVRGKEYLINTLYLGVPHTVIEGKLESFDVNEGKYIEKMDIFKEGTNVNFIEIISPDEVKVMTFERGAGPTLACGTGTCASVYFLFKRNKLNQKVLAHVPGGDMTIYIKDDEIFMEGPAEVSFKGQILGE